MATNTEERLRASWKGLLRVDLVSIPVQAFNAMAADSSDERVRPAESLIDAATEPECDIAAYQDVYKERLRRLIDAKVQGRRLPSPSPEEVPQVVSFVEALQKSLARHPAGRAADGHPAAHEPNRRAS
jgi:non-homologous end joining protein Ku